MRNIFFVLLQIFSRIHLKGEWEVTILEITYPSLYQNGTEEKFTFIDGRKFGRKKKIQPIHIEPRLYSSFVDKIAAINDKIRKRVGAQNFEYNGIYVVYVSVDKITQNNANHLS